MNRIAIVEDDQGYRDTLFTYIKQYEQERDTAFEATPFEKADDFLAVYNGDYDIILMDIEMPGMNGLDAARAVLEQRPECKVIFVTAYSLFQYAHEAMHLGACDYLLKPVNPDEVEASIRAIHDYCREKLGYSVCEITKT